MFQALLAAAPIVLPALTSMFNANKANKPTGAERIAEKYYSAAADPESDLMRRYAAAEESRLNRDFSTRLQQLISQNRRQTSMGRTPLFDPETADQSLYRAGALYGAEAGDTARSNARSSLQGIADRYSGLIKPQQERQSNQAEFNTNVAQSGSDLLSLLLKRQQSPSLSQIGGMINL
jgi:hypothetical protein